MWQDCIDEMMSPHISVGVWGLWCPQPKTEISSGTTSAWSTGIYWMWGTALAHDWTKWNRTATKSWCSCRWNSRICSRSAAPHQSCAPTGRPICDPKPDEDAVMEIKQHYFITPPSAAVLKQDREPRHKFHLKSGPVPWRVPVGGSLHVTKLDLIGSIGTVDPHWEFHLEELVGFSPLHLKS